MLSDIIVKPELAQTLRSSRGHASDPIILRPLYL